MASALAMVATKTKPNPSRPYVHYRSSEPLLFPLSDACAQKFPPLVTYSFFAGKRSAGAAMVPAASVATQVPAAPGKPRTARQNIKIKIRSTSQVKVPRLPMPAVPRARLTACHEGKLKPFELGEATITQKIWSAGTMKSRVNRDRAAPEPHPLLLADACPPGLRFGFYFPVQQSAPLPPRKGVLAVPWDRRPPHKFTAAFSGRCGVGERRAAAVAAPATSMPNKVPAASRKPWRPQRMTRSRSQAKAPRPRNGAVPRARLAAWHGMKLNPSELGEARTLLIHNIPTHLRCEDMLKLLDEHCSRVNRAAGAVIAAYDVVFLPMHFRKEVNLGYALINFTSSTAANGLYYSLQNCGSKKVIKIYRAKQQGKAKLLQHLRRLMRKCDNDEFLPAELLPPRDGVNVPAAPRRVPCCSRKQCGDMEQATQQLQFFIKPWNQRSMSVQINPAEMSVDNLIQLACKKFRISAIDAYVVFKGKVLDGEDYLSNYPVCRDSTVEIRQRSRAGQAVKTFNQQFNLTDAEMFDYIQLPRPLQKQGFTPISSVKFFSDRSSGYLHELFKFITGRHREGKSLNGCFSSTDIVFVGGRAHIIVKTEVDFDENSCARDYKKLREIFVTKFGPYGYPCCFSQLLEYLDICPAKGFSNTEAVIAFVTNHPCIQPLEDVMKQITVLANILDRLDPTELAAVKAALGPYPDWDRDHSNGVPEMDKVYYNSTRGDFSGSTNVNVKYTLDPVGCIYYSNNYLKHADTRLGLDAVVAAYCLHFEGFFTRMFFNLACQLHQTPWVTSLIRNRLADKRGRERNNS